MSIDAEQFFDKENLAALRGLKRDRTLTILAGARPWEEAGTEEPVGFVACIDAGNDVVLAGSPTLVSEQQDAIMSLLLKAMLNPDGTRGPRLPRRVTLEDAEVAETIVPFLRRLNVEVTVEPIPALDEAIEAIRQIIAEMPAWFADPEKGLPIYEAAAAMWAAQPWDVLWGEGASAVITIGSPIDRTLWMLAALGEDDEHPMAMFFVNQEALRKLQAGNPIEDQALGPDALSIVYVDFEDVEDDEIERVTAHRLPIGSGSSFPRFMRSGVEDSPRNINDDEATLMTLAMDAVARFCFSQRARLAVEEGGDDQLSADVFVRHGDELIRASVVTPAPLGLP